MKSIKFKIIIALFAFLLGIAGVWLIGGFSFLPSLFKRDDVVSEISAQTNEVLPELDSSKNDSVEIHGKTYPFKDYPVPAIYKGKNASLKLIGEHRRVYGEKLQWTIEHTEVDFAGHYLVASWSCGMWCDWNAIIDAETGKVYWWDGITSRCFPDLDKDFECNENFSNVEYRIDSKLIVFFGQRNDVGDRGFHHYKFENGKFIHLKSISVKEQRSNSQIQLDKVDEKANSNKSLEK